jgi:hypothetical protein
VSDIEQFWRKLHDASGVKNVFIEKKRIHGKVLNNTKNSQNGNLSVISTNLKDTLREVKQWAV